MPTEDEVCIEYLDIRMHREDHLLPVSELSTGKFGPSLTSCDVWDIFSLRSSLADYLAMRSG